MKFRTMIFAALTAGLTACSNNDDAVETGRALQVDAQIADATTRLGIGSSTFGANDSIGVYQSGETKQYVYAADSVGKLSSSAPYYFSDNSSVGFTAYYPYSAKTRSDGSVAVNTATQSDTLDIMFASEKTTSVAKSSVKFTFRHMMSKISIKLVSDGSFTSADTINATLDGLYTVGTFNTLTGATTTDSETKGNISVAVAAPSAESADSSVIGTMEAIVLPQTPAGNVTLRISINSLTLSVTFPLSAIETGHNYAFTAKVTKVSLILSSSSITQWSEGFSEYVWEEMEYLKED